MQPALAPALEVGIALYRCVFRDIVIEAETCFIEGLIL